MPEPPFTGRPTHHDYAAPPYANVALTSSASQSLINVRRRAELRDDALAAERCARLADFTPVGDEEVREQNPVGLRHERRQVLLDLLGGLLARQAQALREAR